MMGCKSMATPMVTNLKKLSDFDSDWAKHVEDRKSTSRCDSTWD